MTPLTINKFEGDPSIATNVYNVNPPFPPNEDPKKYYDVSQKQLERLIFEINKRRMFKNQ